MGGNDGGVGVGGCESKRWWNERKREKWREYEERKRAKKEKVVEWKEEGEVEGVWG